MSKQKKVLKTGNLLKLLLFSKMHRKQGGQGWELKLTIYFEAFCLCKFQLKIKAVNVFNCCNNKHDLNEFTAFCFNIT